MRRSRTLRLFALCFALPLLAGSCGTAHNADLGVNHPGKLVVCSDIPYPPMEVDGKGPDGLQYTGFDIDLLDAIAKMKGLKLDVRDVDFEGIFGKLVAGDCDVVASALVINSDRKKMVGFSDAYFDAGQSLLVKSSSRVTKLADLAGKTIGVQSGTVGRTYARAHQPPGATVKDFTDTYALFSALEANHVAAVLQDLVVNAGQARASTSVKVVETFKTNEKYGFAMGRYNKDLLKTINDGLRMIRADGIYAKLYIKYFPERQS